MVKLLVGPSDGSYSENFNEVIMGIELSLLLTDVVDDFFWQN